MGDIWFTSDLHFNHDKDFIWGARGYSSVNEMNRIQIEKFNSVVERYYHYLCLTIKSKNL